MPRWDARSVEFVRNYPGQEQQVWDYYRKNPQALAQLRAPIFEEKVVDHIIGQAKVTDRTVSREEIMRVEEEPGPARKPAEPVLDAPEGTTEQVEETPAGSDDSPA